MTTARNSRHSYGLRDPPHNKIASAPIISTRSFPARSRMNSIAETNNTVSKGIRFTRVIVLIMSSLQPKPVQSPTATNLNHNTLVEIGALSLCMRSVSPLEGVGRPIKQRKCKPRAKAHGESGLHKWLKCKEDLKDEVCRCMTNVVACRFSFNSVRIAPHREDREERRRRKRAQIALEDFDSLCSLVSYSATHLR